MRLLITIALLGCQTTTSSSDAAIADTRPASDGSDASLNDAGHDSASPDVGWDVGSPDSPSDAARDAPLSFLPDLMNMTFEDGVVGESAGGGTGFPLTRPAGEGMYSDGRLIWEFSDDQVFAGSAALKLNIVGQVASETNTVGGTVATDTPDFVGEGDELWWRAMVYLPSDHNPSTLGSSDLKWFRVYRQNAAGEQRGALEFKLSPGGAYRFGNEFGTEFHNVEPADEDRWTSGWNAFELYARFSSDAGTVRFWRNNRLVYEFDVVTLPAGADRMWRTQFIAYWNCARRGQCGLSNEDNDRVPRTQMPIYVDDMIATTSHSPPVERDDAGNLFIGGAYE